MSDFKCDEMDKCQGDCGPWCTGYNRALAIQKLDEVKAEIECTNMLTAQSMIKLIEVFKYSLEIQSGKTRGQIHGDALWRAMSNLYTKGDGDEKNLEG